jgi:uncharacterized protein
MSKEFVARRLDVKRFAGEGAKLSGSEPVQAHERLAAEADGQASSEVTWSAQGEMRNPRHIQPEIWIHLKARTELPMTCQRCLGKVDVAVAADRSFRFVSDEAMAAAQDEEAEEDVLSLDASFDLLTLIEDELLMELPLAPMHEVCPAQMPMQAVDEDFDSAPAKENPFAVLGSLKSRKS